MSEPRWDAKQVARGCRFRGVLVGSGAALHLVGPAGGATLCGRKPTRLVAPPREHPGWGEAPLCRVCLRALGARVHVSLR